MTWTKRLINTISIGYLSRVERAMPFRPLEDIERRQRKRLGSIVKHAYETVPFYRAAMQKRGLLPRDFRSADDLAKLPLIDGIMVRREPEQFISSRYDPKNCQLLSSGKGKTVYWDKVSSLRKLAHAERDRTVLNSLVGRGWGQCQLYLLPSKSMSLSVRDFWNSQLFVPKNLAERHFVFAEQPFDAAVEKMNAVRPQVVYSYGSYLDQFFRFLKHRNLKAALPPVWVYGGDMLPHGSKEQIENEFGCKVYSTYQAVETGRFGFQCERRQGFHLNIDLCTVRLINAAGEPAAETEAGEVVISNLHNRAMVLLNYRLGDHGMINSKPCSCGRSLPLLEKFEGHYTGNISLANGQIISTNLLQVACKDLLGRALQYQVLQSAPGQISWQIVPFADVNCETMKRSIIKKSLEVVGKDMAVSVNYVDRIPSNASGKFQFGGSAS